MWLDLYGSPGMMFLVSYTGREPEQEGVLAPYRDRGQEYQAGTHQGT